MVLKKSRAAAPVAAHQKFLIDGAWAVDPLIHQPEIYSCAWHALLGATTPKLKALQRSLPQVPTAAHKPVASGSKSGITWATWHYGKDFYTYWCGDVTTVLHMSHLTDTEREIVLLRARKAEVQGAITFATGAKLTHEIPHSVQPSIEHIGLVFARAV